MPRVGTVEPGESVTVRVRARARAAPAGGVWWSSQDELVDILELTAAEADQKAKDLLEQIAEGVKAALEREAGRAILVASVVEYFDSGIAQLHLKNFPVQSVIAIHHDPTRMFGPSTLIPPERYRLINSVVYLQPFPAMFASRKTRNAIRVAYEGGYTELPADVRRVFRAELRREWQNRKRPDVQSLSVVGSSVSISTPYGLMPESRRVMAAYRIPVW